MKKTAISLSVVEMIGASILVVLWTYSLSKKMHGLSLFRAQMADQIFPERVVPFLVYGILGSQLLVVLLLLVPRLRFLGFVVSLILLVIFSGYMGAILLHAFNRVPCHCISFIPGMTFRSHLYFNLFFVAVAAIGLLVNLKKERRNKGMDRIESHAPLTA